MPDGPGLDLTGIFKIRPESQSPLFAQDPVLRVADPVAAAPILSPEEALVSGFEQQIRTLSTYGQVPDGLYPTLEYDEDAMALRALTREQEYEAGVREDRRWNEKVFRESVAISTLGVGLLTDIPGEFIKTALPPIADLAGAVLRIPEWAEHLNTRVSAGWDTVQYALTHGDPQMAIAQLFQLAHIIPMEDKERRLAEFDRRMAAAQRDRLANPTKSIELLREAASWLSGISREVEEVFGEGVRELPLDPGHPIAHWFGGVVGGVVPWVFAHKIGGKAGIVTLGGSIALDTAVRVTEEEGDVGAGVAAGALEAVALWAVFRSMRVRGGRGTQHATRVFARVDPTARSLLARLTLQGRAVELGKAATQYVGGVSEITAIRAAQHYIDQIQRALVGPTLLATAMERANRDLAEVLEHGVMEGVSLMALAGGMGLSGAAAGPFTNRMWGLRGMQAYAESAVMRDSLWISLDGAGVRQYESLLGRLRSDPDVSGTTHGKHWIRVLEARIEAKIKGEEFKAKDVLPMERIEHTMTEKQATRDLEKANAGMKRAIEATEGLALRVTAKLDAGETEALKDRSRVLSISEKIEALGGDAARLMSRSAAAEREFEMMDEGGVLLDMGVSYVDMLPNASLAGARNAVAKIRSRGELNGETLTSEQIRGLDTIDRVLRRREEVAAKKGTELTKELADRRGELTNFDALTGRELQALEAKLGLRSGAFAKMTPARKAEIRKALGKRISELESESLLDPKDAEAAEKAISRLEGTVSMMADRSIMVTNRGALRDRMQNELGIAYRAGRRGTDIATGLLRGSNAARGLLEAYRKGKRKGKEISRADFERNVRDSGLSKDGQKTVLDEVYDFKKKGETERALGDLLETIHAERQANARKSLASVFREATHRDPAERATYHPGLKPLLMRLLRAFDPKRFDKTGLAKVSGKEAERLYEEATGDPMDPLMRDIVEKIERDGFGSLDPAQVEAFSRGVELIRDQASEIVRGDRLSEQVRIEMRDEYIMQEIENTWNPTLEGESASLWKRTRDNKYIKFLTGLETHGRLPTILEYLSGGNNTELHRAIHGDLEMAHGRLQERMFELGDLAIDHFASRGLDIEVLTNQSRNYNVSGFLGRTKTIMRHGLAAATGKKPSDAEYRIEIDKGEWRDMSAPDLVEYLNQHADVDTSTYLLGGKNSIEFAPRPGKAGMRDPITLNEARHKRIVKWIRENRPDLFEWSDAMMEFYNHPDVVRHLVDWQVSKYGQDFVSGQRYAPRRVSGEEHKGVTLEDLAEMGGLKAIGRRGVEYRIGWGRVGPGQRNIIIGDAIKVQNEYINALSVLSTMEAPVREARRILRKGSETSKAMEKSGHGSLHRSIEKNFLEPLVRELTGTSYEHTGGDRVAHALVTRATSTNLMLNADVAAYQGFSLLAAAGEMGVAGTARYLMPAVASTLTRQALKVVPFVGGAPKGLSSRANAHGWIRSRYERANAHALISTGVAANPTLANSPYGKRRGRSNLGWLGISSVDRGVILTIYRASELKARDILRQKTGDRSLRIDDPMVQKLAGEMARDITNRTQPTFDAINNAAINNQARRSASIRIVNAFRGYVSKITDLMILAGIRAGRARNPVEASRILAKSTFQTIVPTMMIPIARNFIRSGVVIQILKSMGASDTEIESIQAEWDEELNLPLEGIQQVISMPVGGEMFGAPAMSLVRSYFETPQQTRMRMNVAAGTVETLTLFLTNALREMYTADDEARTLSGRHRQDSEKRRLWSSSWEALALIGKQGAYPGRRYFQAQKLLDEHRYKRNIRRNKSGVGYSQ